VCVVVVGFRNLDALYDVFARWWNRPELSDRKMSIRTQQRYERSPKRASNVRRAHAESGSSQESELTRLRNQLKAAQAAYHRHTETDYRG